MNKRGLGGFALPTVLVASIIMMVVLLSAVSATTAVRSAIVDQYYNQLSRSAADSGLSYAEACLEANGVTWSDSSPLGPNTDCYGVQLAGFTCVDNYSEPRCFASFNDRVVSTFSVMTPDYDAAGEITKISSRGTTALLSKSDNTAWRQYNNTSKLVVNNPAPSNPTSSVKVLVVAGGGGGGGQLGGGGGGGGVIYKPKVSITAGQDITVTVGAGGPSAATGSTNQGSNGSDSIFGTIVAKGGGGGGGNVASAIGKGLNGGSGGGEAENAYGVGLGTNGQGKNGGTANNAATAYGSGGGGGAVGVGGNGTTTAGGAGGTGYTSNDFSSYGGGGGGAVFAGILPGVGGSGGGGLGAINGGGNAVAGTVNKGGGGGGNNPTSATGNGGSGVVKVSYPTGSLTATGGTITTSGGDTIHTFTSGSSTFSVTSVGAWKYKRPMTVTNSNATTLTNSQVKVTPFSDASLLNNTGLVGSWHFNEDFGILNTLAYDMSGTGNHGLMGGATFRTTAGKFGGAFIGDGTQLNKVLIPYHSSINMTTSLSIEAWVYPAGAVTKEIVGRMNSGGTAPVAYELFQNGQKISFRLYKSPGSTTWTTNTNLSLNSWHHIVATWDGTTAKVYVDGVLDMTPGALASPIDSSTTVGLSIGAYGDNNYRFNGKIDEVKLYNRALSGPATNCNADSVNEVCRRYGPLGVPKIRSDYADIRFTNSDGTVNYPYWQETDSKFWVKIPSLAVGDTVINMQYGNPNASDASNGDDTFLFFDDFAGSVMDTSKWAEIDTKGAITQSDGLVLTSVTDVWDSGLFSKIGFTRTIGLTIGGSFKAGTSVAAPCYMMVGWGKNQETPVSYTELVHGLYYQAGTFASVYEMSSAYPMSGSYTANSVNLFDVKLKSTGADYYNNSSALYTGFGGSLTTSPMRVSIQQRNHTGTFNYIYVRQGSSIEPTLSAPGAETSLFNYFRL